MYRLLREGRLGNFTKRLSGSVDLATLPLNTRVSVRSLEVGKFFEITTLDKALSRIKTHIVTVSPSDENLILQGEIMRSHLGLELFYNMTPNISHRDAMKNAKNVTGVNAVVLLKHVAPEDYEHLVEIMDAYDAIVEFSVYSMPEGEMSRRTLIWEVRNY